MVGIGFEYALPGALDRWALRLEGSYLQLGAEIYEVNESGDSTCGPDGAATACPYEIKTGVPSASVSILRRFAFF